MAKISANGAREYARLAFQIETETGEKINRVLVVTTDGRVLSKSKWARKGSRWSGYRLRYTYKGLAHNITALDFYIDRLERMGFKLISKKGVDSVNTRA